MKTQLEQCKAVIRANPGIQFFYAADWERVAGQLLRVKSGICAELAFVVCDIVFSVDAVKQFRDIFTKSKASPYWFLGFTPAKQRRRARACRIIAKALREVRKEKYER